MNLYSTIWKCIFVFSFSIKDCPLHPASCQHFNDLGYLTVEPAPPFLLGSNLTVYCHIKECVRSKIFLVLQNNENVDPSERVNCTTAMFNLFNVRMPITTVLCKRDMKWKLENVNALDLHGGYLPDKPENIICETTRSSDSINCSWVRGRETHLRTAYNISINRENETPVLLDQIQGVGVISIPRAKIEGHTTYQLIITAYNHFGASQSDPFNLCVNDILIPETPRIMHIEFLNDSIAALLRWKTAESSEHLRSCVRLRTDNNSWEAGEGTELSKGLVQVEGLKPLTEYEFQMRTCILTSGLTHTNMPCLAAQSASSKRSFCSRWSPSVRGKSPGKGPSQQLHVWRILGVKGKMVTVLWKPPSPEDYSGEVKQYEIALDNDLKRNKTCSAALSQCSAQIPAEVQTLSISVVTLYGSSPPADVPLRHSGTFGPVLRELAPAANGSAVFVSWSWPENKYWLPSGGKLLHYVLEWTSVHVAELQWQKLDKDKNKTSITGLTAGVRYNISLYAVTTRGVSTPSSRLVYSKEQKPQSGPSMSVLVHKTRWIQIQWDELPVDQQRGFITNYTIYIQTLDSSNTELSFTVSGSAPTQRWLDCPDGALTLQMTASTSAGEGPWGSRTSSQPAAPAVSLVIVLVFIITLFIGIIANLLCWSCVRQRVKQKCISWGPVCIGENLPKPGNSLAIRLLKQEGSEPSFSSINSDPPLSPISLISQEERDDVYPTIHIEFYQARPGDQTARTPLLISDPEAMLVDTQVEHVSYKPHISMLAPQGEEVVETEEEQRDLTTSGQEDRSFSVPEGLFGGLLSTVEMDFSVSPLGLTLSSVSDLLWHETSETSVLNGSISLERRGTENQEVDSPCLDLQQGEITICDTADTCLSQYRTERTLTDGYFPQVAAVNRTTGCDTKR
uniref:interleukin-23 receptor n=1 Tax=Semicossyphus pulcher TaxID=241346 RepID=UPI0037E73288